MADCKLTPELQKVIFKNLKKGATFETAAQAVGISRRTLHNWIAEGEKGNPDFTHFSQTIKEIRAEVELELIETVYDAARKEPEHAKWLLSHMNQEAWGNKTEQKIEHSGRITFEQFRDLFKNNTTTDTATIPISNKDTAEPGKPADNK